MKATVTRLHVEGTNENNGRADFDKCSKNVYKSRSILRKTGDTMIVKQITSIVYSVHVVLITKVSIWHTYTHWKKYWRERQSRSRLTLNTDTKFERTVDRTAKPIQIVPILSSCQCTSPAGIQTRKIHKLADVGDWDQQHDHPCRLLCAIVTTLKGNRNTWRSPVLHHHIQEHTSSNANR